MKPAIITLCLTLTASAAAADQLEDITARGELVCGTMGATRGLSFIDTASRQLVGYEVDLCHAIAESIGVAPHMATVGVQARIPELDAGRIDILIANLAYTPARAEQVDYSNPYLVTRTAIMVSDPGVTSFADLAGRKVSAAKGSTLEAAVRKHLPQAEVLALDAGAQAFMAFRQGKAAGYASDEMSLLLNRTLLGEAGKDLVILDETLEMEHVGIGIRKGETALRDAINAALDGLEASGEAEEMFLKWLGPDTEIGFERRGFRIDGNWQPN